jgi:hypothetical protein
MTRDKLNSLMAETNREAAQLLAGRSGRLREMPEQQADFTTALGLLIEREDRETMMLSLRPTQLPVGELLSDDFPGLGGVDLTVEREGSPFALIELKFGRDTLWNSVWDLCKLALALRRGVGSRAFMAGGAPLRSWDRERQGPDLFESATYETGSLLIAYANCFRHWPTAPERLPSRIGVAIVDTVRFENDEGQYEMRIVEVFDPGSAWIEVAQELGSWPMGER